MVHRAISVAVSVKLYLENLAVSWICLPLLDTN